MKKIRMIVLTLIIAFLVPTSAFANTDNITPLGAGQWDNLGTRNITLGNGTVVIYDSKYWSSGRDYKVHVSGLNSYNLFSIWVTEEDLDGSNSLVYNLTKNGNANGDYIFSTKDVDDGSNGKVELRFEFNGALHHLTI